MEEPKEFKVIETQEQLDDVIKGRLARERAKFADYDDIKAKLADYETRLGTAMQESEGFNNRIAELEATITERDATIQQMATTALKSRISAEFGLPSEMADRLKGDNEEELRADAETLAQLIPKPATVSAPMRTAEPKVDEDGVMKAFLRMNPNLKLN